MQIFMVKTIEIETGETNWFLVTGSTIEDAKEQCEDGVTHVLEVIANMADIAIEVDHEFGGCALFSGV